MEVLVNAIANLVIAVSVSLFVVAIFGSNNKTINSLSQFEKLFIRIGLSATACGALFNLLTLSNPQSTEILMNIGLSLIFSWGVHFHFKYFIKKKKK